MANLLDVIRETFVSRLQTQSSWGKNQIEALYTEVQRDVLSFQITNEEILGESVKFTMNKTHWDNLQNGTHKKEKPTNHGFYNPRGSNTYNDVEHNISDDDSPFHNDEDIVKY